MGLVLSVIDELMPTQFNMIYPEDFWDDEFEQDLEDNLNVEVQPRRNSI